MRLLGIRPRHSDERRGVPADALEGRHDRAAKLDAPAGADGARIHQLAAVVIADQQGAEIGSSTRLAPISADDVFLPVGALDLNPIADAAGAVW
jgi:hypothetical protein